MIYYNSKYMIYNDFILISSLDTLSPEKWYPNLYANIIDYK